MAEGGNSPAETRFTGLLRAVISPFATYKNRETQGSHMN